MNSNRTLWIVLVIVALMLCCCVTTVVTFALARSVDWGGLTFWQGRVEVTKPFDRTVDVRAPVRLTVDVPVGDITIKVASDQQVRATATVRAWGANRTRGQAILDQITVSLEQTGDQVQVKVTGLEGIRNVPRSPQVDVVISVPRDTAIQLDTNVGQVHIAGTRGNMALKVDVGEVILTDVLPADRLEIETRVASIELEAGLAPGATYQLTSDVGRIAVRLPADSAFRLDSRSDIGDVRVDFPVAGQSSREGIVGKDVRGTVGTNPTASLSLRSRVGEITVRPGQ